MNYKKYLFKKEEINIYTFINNVGMKRIVGADLLSYKNDLKNVNLFKNKKINIIIHDLEAIHTVFVDYFKDNVELNEEIDIASIELVTDELGLQSVRLELTERSFESGASEDDIFDIINNLPSYEPKLKNRFVVDFPKVIDIPFDIIKSIEKPRYSDEQWHPINIQLYDYVIPSATSKVFNLMKYAEINKTKDILFIYRHYDIDPTGKKVQKWVVDVDYVTDFNFGYNDNSIDNINVVSFTIIPKKCTLIY